MALTNNEQNVNPINGNSPERMDYLSRQDDVKCILKWHFGVKLFRAWIESKNAPIRQRLLQRKNFFFERFNSKVFLHCFRIYSNEKFVDK